MKKGISPLLAVSILVGFVIVLSIIVLNFFDVFSDERLDDIEDREFVERACSERSKLNFEFCKRGTSEVRVKITNEGDLGIQKFDSEFKFFNETAGILKIDSSTIGIIEPYGFAGFTAAGFGSGPGGGVPDFGKISELSGFYYIKNVTYDSGSILCPKILKPLAGHQLEECS
jgi:flagellin-like protein